MSAADPQTTPEEKRIVVESPPAFPGADKQAMSEAAVIAAKKYNRDDKMQDHLHNATVCLLYVFTGVLGIMALVWVWNLVCPSAWEFLSQAQQDRLTTALFAAVGSSFVTDRAKKILK